MSKIESLFATRLYSAPLAEFESAEQGELLSKLQKEGLVKADSDWVRVTDSGRFKLLQLWDPDSGDLRVVNSA